MATRPALVDLSQFLLEPSTVNASKLVSIPTLYDILRYEERISNGRYSSTVLGLCTWIYNRAREVLRELTVDTEIPPTFNGVAENAYEDWHKVVLYLHQTAYMI